MSGIKAHDNLASRGLHQRIGVHHIIPVASAADPINILRQRLGNSVNKIEFYSSFLIILGAFTANVQYFNGDQKEMAGTWWKTNLLVLLKYRGTSHGLD